MKYKTSKQKVYTGKTLKNAKRNYQMKSIYVVTDAEIININKLN